MADVNYEIVEHLATLGENPKTHWTKEINLVKRYNREEKYDIRDWAPGRERYGKGVTLSKEEFDNLIQFAQGQMSLDGLEFKE